MDATIIPKMQKHYPVLLKEIISVISPQHGGTFIDCTFGQGGYSKKILEFKNTKVIGLDRDIESQKVANSILENFEDRFIFKNLKFSQLTNLKIKNENIKICFKMLARAEVMIDRASQAGDFPLSRRNILFVAQHRAENPSQKWWL